MHIFKNTTQKDKSTTQKDKTTVDCFANKCLSGGNVILFLQIYLQLLVIQIFLVFTKSHDPNNVSMAK